MMNRCIMIFPKFNNIDLINNLREKYDPLAKHVAPHVTLVFPFASEIASEDLKEHLSKSVSGVNPFKLCLKGITPTTIGGNYLFLNIEEGLEEVTQLHKNLYSGILEGFMPEWLKANKYFPHLTIGHIEDDSLFKKAIEETKGFCESFETMVNEVIVEIIDENEDSIIEITTKLR